MILRLDVGLRRQNYEIFGETNCVNNYCIIEHQNIVDRLEFSVTEFYHKSEIVITFC
jgi:hypothetical protein